MATFKIPQGYPAHLLSAIPGATVTGNEIVLPGSESEGRKAIESATEGKKFVSVESKAYTPDESDMARVRSLMDADFPIDKLGFRILDTCNTIKDRDDDVLDKSFLDELARQDNDESRVVLLYHNTEKIAGRKFRAEVLPEIFPNNESGFKLREYVYFHKDYATDGNIPLGDKIASGTIKDVSIGFYGSGRRYDEGTNTRTFYHEPGTTQTENLETSFVYLGAQYYSRIAKSADFKTVNIDTPKYPIRMEKVNIKVGAEVKTFTTEPGIQGEFDAMQKARTDAENAKTAAEAKATGLQAQLDGLKTPLIANALIKQASLKDEMWTESQMKTWDLAQITKYSAQLDNRHKSANPSLNDTTETVKDADGNVIDKTAEPVDFLKAFAPETTTK